MFSDSAGRNIVLFVFLIYYIYLNYVSSKLILERAPKNIKCSPIQSMFGSLFEGEEAANENYNKCLELSTQQQIDQQNELMNNEAAEISENIKDIEDENNTGNYNALAQINNKSLSTKGLIEQQRQLHKSMNDLSPDISGVFTKIGEITAKLPKLLVDLSDNIGYN